MDNINWVGNKVVDASTPRPASRPGTSASQLQQQNITADNTADMTQQGPPPSSERGYIPYYLKQNIGKNMRAEFIIGSNQYTDRTGRLIEVGINYFVLEDVNSRTHVMCDLYSVKFVTILQD